MHDGIKIVQVPGNFYGRGVTMVGWMRRVGGDEWELLPGARVIYRQSGNYSYTGLDDLAAKGPGKSYGLAEPTLAGEHVHRLLIRRSKPATWAGWLDLCPKPKDWSDAQ